MRNRPGAMVDVVIGDGIGRMSLTFFAKNVGAAEWRSKDLAVGRRGVFSGKVGEFNGVTQFAHPEYELFDDEDSARRSADARAAVPIPIYSRRPSAIQTWQIRSPHRAGAGRSGRGARPPHDRHQGAGWSCSRPGRALERIHRPRTRATTSIRPFAPSGCMRRSRCRPALLQQRDAVRALSRHLAAGWTGRPPRAVRRGDAVHAHSDQETVGGADRRRPRRIVADEPGSSRGRSVPARRWSRYERCCRWPRAAGRRR